MIEWIASQPALLQVPIGILVGTLALLAAAVCIVALASVRGGARTFLDGIELLFSISPASRTGRLLRQAATGPR